MEIMESIYIIGGFLLLIYTIIASAYLSDVRRSAEEARKTSGKDKEKVLNDKHKLDLLFRISTLFAAFTIVIMLLPFYFAGEEIILVCKWLLLIPIAFILHLFARYALGKYFVKYE